MKINRNNNKNNNKYKLKIKIITKTNSTKMSKKWEAFSQNLVPLQQTKPKTPSNYSGIKKNPKK